MADSLQQLQQNTRRFDNQQRKYEMETVRQNYENKREPWPPKGNQNSSTSPIICYACNLTGHISRNCPNRPLPPQSLLQKPQNEKRQEN